MKIEVKRSFEYYRQAIEICEEMKQELLKLRMDFDRYMLQYTLTGHQYNLRKACEIQSRILAVANELKTFARKEIDVIEQFKRDNGL